MAISYPASLDSAVGPGPAAANRATTATNDATFPHGAAHKDISDAIVQLETRVGISGSILAAVKTAIENMPGASNYAVFASRNANALAAFNDTTNYTAMFVGVMPANAVLSSGLIIKLFWIAASATSGNVVWKAQVDRVNTGANITSDSFDTAASVTDACQGTNGQVTVSSISISTIDSIAAGDGYRIQVIRDASNGSDTMAGDAQLFLVAVYGAA